MIRFLIFLALLLLFQAVDSTAQHKEVHLDVMTTAVSEQSLDSVPVKVSIPDGLNTLSIKFDLMGQESGKVLFTGTPYDTVRVQVPSRKALTNQFGTRASLRDLSLMHGESNDISAMEVLSPAGCTTLTVPRTGRLHLRLGAILESDQPLKGIYTTRLPLSCDPD